MADYPVQVRSAVAFEEEAIRLIEVGLVCGDQRQDVILDYKNPVTTAVFNSDDKRHPVQYQYRAYAHSGPFTQGPQSSFEAPPRTTEAQIIVIDPRELYRLVDIKIVSVLDPERYRAAFVDVKVDGEGWSATETAEVSHDRREFRIRFMAGTTSAVTVQHRIRYVTRPGAVIEGAWQAVGPGAIVVANPAETTVGAGQ